MTRITYQDQCESIKNAGYVLATPKQVEIAKLLSDDPRNTTLHASGADAHFRRRSKWEFGLKLQGSVTPWLYVWLLGDPMKPSESSEWVAADIPERAHALRLRVGDI